MSALLEQIAEDVGVSERTLRRAINEGTVHAHRPSPQTLDITPAERRYVRTHWPLVGALRRALRTEPGVEAAVLFGSTARGDDVPSSDVDLLVWLRQGDTRAARKLRARLEYAVGRPVQVVDADAAGAKATLLEAVIRDGRVLVDRGACWEDLRERERGIRRRAARERRELAQRGREADEFFAARGAR